MAFICSFFACCSITGGRTDTILSEIKAPAQEFPLHLERDCAATTPISTIVCVVSKGDTFDGDKDPRVLVICGKAEVTARWTGTTEAEVTYPADMEKEVFTKEGEVAGVTFKYVKKP